MSPHFGACLRYLQCANLHCMQLHADDAVQVAAHIGARVRGARQARGWTLDDLAARSGVSRRAVVNVEQGASSPSIDTLLKLARALGASLASLVEDATASPVVVHRHAEHTVLWRGERGGEARLTATTMQPNVVELWDWTLGPDEEYVSTAHALGTREALHVIVGVVEVQVGDERVRLRAGDAVAFSGDVPHAYANPHKRSARFSLAVYDAIADTRQP